MCTQGQYFEEPSAGTQTCSSCPTNTYQDSPSHRNTECTDQPVCASGLFYAAEPTSERTCSQCPAFLYRPEGSHRETGCLASSVLTCSDTAGTFNQTSGECNCAEGYSGSTCSEVAAGYCLSDVLFESRRQDESDRNLKKVLPPVASISGGSVVVAYIYLLNGGAPNGATSFTDLPLTSHLWATLSVGLKVLDMMTDWAFHVISLRGEPFESVYMYQLNGTRRGVGTGRYNPDVVAIQTASVISCSCGTLLTFFDIYGTRQRLGGVVGVASLTTLMVMLVEDAPQLSINIIYVKTMAAAAGSKPDTISLLSLASSGCTLLYSLYLLISDCRKGKGDTDRRQQRQAGGERVAMTVNAAYRGSGVQMSNVAGFAVGAVGEACIIRSVGSGVIRFVGLHAETQMPVIGVEMNKPKGENNGSVNGHKYFKCKDGHGLLTIPSKVVINDEYLEVGGADASVGSNA